jgi:hypothetical protein
MRIIMASAACIVHILGWLHNYSVRMLNIRSVAMLKIWVLDHNRLGRLEQRVRKLRLVRPNLGYLKEGSHEALL